ncbi:unnamed protein product [Amoebophrya sp. A120]|nr:unnamed protein product [Amoebophrya sp. A120]|eukprot:GSA120T00013279001.1
MSFHFSVRSPCFATACADPVTDTSRGAPIILFVLKYVFRKELRSNVQVYLEYCKNYTIGY